MALVFRKQPRKSEVSNLGLKIIVKKYIFTFDIPMDDRNTKILMQVNKPTSNANNYIKSLSPTEVLFTITGSYMFVKDLKTITNNL